MRIGPIEVKRRVWIGSGFALVAIAGWWIWTRAKPLQPVVDMQVKSPFVQLTGSGKHAGDDLLRERSALFDPAPLFFPTEWNYGQRSLPESMSRQPEQVFENFPANFTFKEQEIKAYGAEVTAAPEQLANVLLQGNETPFGGMGQIDVARPALAERSSFLEVKALSGGKTIISQALNGLKLPRVDFAPMEFLVVVSSGGIVGEPVLMTESSLETINEEVDAFFRSYLVKTFHLGERVSPGRYRVLVGP